MQHNYSHSTHMTFSSMTSVPSLDEDQTAMWPPATGSVQPGSGFTSDWTAVPQQPYGTSLTLPETAAAGFGSGPSAPQYADWDAVYALWGIPESVLDDIASKLDLPNMNFAPCATPTPPLTDDNTAWSTSTVSSGVVPFPPSQASAAHSQDPVLPESRSLALPSPTQGDHTKPNPFAGVGIPYPTSRENAQGYHAPAHGGGSSLEYAGSGNTLSYTEGWWPRGPDSNTAASLEARLPMAPALTTPDVILGKRPRGSGKDGTVGNGSLEAEGYDPRPTKKGKGSSNAEGTLGVAGPSSRVQYKSATRNPKEINYKSKAMGHGAGEHATTTAQGLYDRFLPGPNIQQESTGAIAQVLTWVQESAQGEEPQQQVAQNGLEVDAGGRLFPIPRSLRERYSKLLAASEADWERGTVNELRCQLCPHVHFSTWEGFKRHCDTTRVHPWDIFICDHCGDYFGRSDSFKRHSRRRPQVCQKAVRERAEAKGRDIKRLHQVFKARMVHCLDNGGEIGTTFFAIVKAKYPSSSKTGAEDN